MTGDQVAALRKLVARTKAERWVHIFVRHTRIRGGGTIPKRSHVWYRAVVDGPNRVELDQHGHLSIGYAPDNLAEAIGVLEQAGALPAVAGESRESGTDVPTGSVPEFCEECGPGYLRGGEGCRHTPPRGSVQPPEAHRCDALCRDVEDERDQLAAEAERVRPVMEAARALREAQRRDVIDRPTTPDELFVRAAEFKPLREAFEAAVDTYEEQERSTGE